MNEPDLRVAILGSVQNMTWKCMYKRVVEVAGVERPQWLFILLKKTKDLNEDMKSYCHNTSTCRRLMLITAFSISSKIYTTTV